MTQLTNAILDPGLSLTLRPMRYPVFFEMFKDGIRNTWTVEEVDFSTDLVDLRSRLTPAEIHLRVEGLPQGVSQVVLEDWQVDHDHSNAFTAWQSMGSPQNPSAVQYQHLKAAGELQMLEARRSVAVKGAAVEFTFTEPAQGISLLGFTW